MSLLIAAILSGISVGLIYGLLGFSVIVLFKATGVVSFAQPNIAMFTAFLGYFILSASPMPLAVNLLIGAGAAAVFGLLLYFLIIRPNDEAGTLNLILRTLALHVLLYEIANTFWATGQPFRFPALVPRESVDLGAGVIVPYVNLANLVVVVLLTASFVMFFTRTKTGLLLRAVADQPETVRLLGVNARRLTALSWLLATVVAFVVGALTAPTSLLSTNMAAPFLLFAFAGALLGGITHWFGAFVGGVIVGVASNVSLVYTNSEIATGLVFLLLLGGLVLKPEGILGEEAIERL